MPLARPKPQSQKRLPARNLVSAAGAGFRADATMVTAQKGMGVRGTMSPRGTLEIEMIFDRPVEAVRVVAYQTDPHNRERVKNGWKTHEGGGAWADGESARLTIPELRADRETTIELRACTRDKTKCGMAQWLKLDAHL